jgi:putative transposase
VCGGIDRNAEGVREFQAQGSALGNKPIQELRTLKEFAKPEYPKSLPSRKEPLPMAQSLSRIWTHLIFSTKDRFPFLTDEQTRRDMHAYLATVLRSHDCQTLLVDGAKDHVHALFALSRKYSISTIVKEVKRTSSSWIKDISRTHRKFHWQNGYGAFSVSQSHLDQVRSYIERQEQHHRRVTFEDEYRAFLKKYEVEYDERYVWD